MKPELYAGERFDRELHTTLIRRATIECCKWDLSVGDVSTIAPYALHLSSRLWNELASLAERLSAEADAAERELLQRPDLFRALGLPARTAEALRGAEWSDAPRFTRFDFHPVADGFRITESNCDVAGGIAEASGVTAILHELMGRPAPLDPAGTFCASFAPGARIGVMHLTEYPSDRQVARYLQRRFQSAGREAHLFHPRALPVDVDAIYRFLPGTWLEQLEDETHWQSLFHAKNVSTPLSSLLPQSKRFALLWPSLETALPTWKSLLPESRDVGVELLRDPQWVLKPAYGYEGAHIAMHGETSADESTALHAHALEHRDQWVLQRRFDATPLATPDGPRFPALGIFVVNGRRAGTFARVSDSRLIDDQAQEALVLVGD